MVESGGAWGECSNSCAASPQVGRRVRTAAMTESQKRIGSLSGSSRESQAQAASAPLGSALRLVPPREGTRGEAATHAESSVDFPLPAAAETSVKG